MCSGGEKEICQNNWIQNSNKGFIKTELGVSLSNQPHSMYERERQELWDVVFSQFEYMLHVLYSTLRQFSVEQKLQNELRLGKDTAFREKKKTASILKLAPII
jgi:hypothetical protein